MRIKTSELQRVSLRWAVAKCEGFSPFTDGISWIIEDKWASGAYKQLPYYSTDWADGGPILEREGIHLICNDDLTEWTASTPRKNLIGWRLISSGPTALIAAMRCYVANKLGMEVDIPDFFFPERQK